MINFSVTYAGLKSLKTSTGLHCCYVTAASYYELFIVDFAREAYYSAQIGKGNADCTDFEDNLKPTAVEYSSVQDGVALEYVASRKAAPLGSDGTPIVITSKPDDTRVTMISADFCDKTSWYQKSTRAVNEVATDTGDHTTYQLAHTDIIDISHGTLTDEDYLKDANGDSYKPTVKADGTSKVERNPHYDSPQAGEHYTINYDTGRITFLSAQDPAVVITCTYYYAGSSSFTVKPAAGKILTITMAEVQFSTDCIPKDTAVFQAYGYVQSFAPGMMEAPYNLPVNTLIPLGPPSKYKGIRDFLNASSRAYPVYPALGGSGWRGLDKPSVVMDWDYQAKTELDSAKGMQIVISLEHNAAWDGTFATATFYCTQK